MKTEMTQNKMTRVISSLEFIYVCAEMAQIEWNDESIDARYKSPAINNFNKKIQSSAEAIKIHLASILQHKDKQREFTEEYCGELYRCVRALHGMPIQSLKEFADGVRDMVAQAEEAAV